MRVWGATPKTHTLFGIVQLRHHHTRHSKTHTLFGIVQLRHHHTRHSKTLQIEYFVHRSVCLGRHPKNTHFLALCISNTPILGIQKYCWWHIWCRGMRVWAATPKQHTFWHCAFQTHPYHVSRNTAGGIFGAEVCPFGEPRQKRTFFGIVHFKYNHTRYPKIMLVACLVRRYAHFGRHPKNTHFMAFCISNTTILGIQ